MVSVTSRSLQWKSMRLHRRPMEHAPVCKPSWRKESRDEPNDLITPGFPPGLFFLLTQLRASLLRCECANGIHKQAIVFSMSTRIDHATRQRLFDTILFVVRRFVTFHREASLPVKKQCGSLRVGISFTSCIMQDECQHDLVSLPMTNSLNMRQSPIGSQTRITAFGHPI